MRVDTQESENILVTTIMDNFDIESDNLIKVNEDDSSYYLMRAGLSNIIVSGKIEQDLSESNISKAPRRIGGINIILANIVDKNIKETVLTNDDGSFETSSLPAGTYNLNIDNRIQTEIKIAEPKEDIGTYKLMEANLHNFKAELILTNEFVYANESLHYGKIRIHNISNEIGYGLYYTVSIDDVDLKSLTNAIVKGSIAPSKYIDIPISMSFNKITQLSKTVDIQVEINDVANQKWLNRLSFTIEPLADSKI